MALARTSLNSSVFWQHSQLQPLQKEPTSPHSYLWRSTRSTASGTWTSCSCTLWDSEGWCPRWIAINGGHACFCSSSLRWELCKSGSAVAGSLPIFAIMGFLVIPTQRSSFLFSRRSTSEGILLIMPTLERMFKNFKFKPPSINSNPHYSTPLSKHLPFYSCIMPVIPTHFIRTSRR